MRSLGILVDPFKFGVLLFEEYQSKNFPRLRGMALSSESACRTIELPRTLSPSVSTAAFQSPDNRQARWPCSEASFRVPGGPFHRDRDPTPLKGCTSITSGPLSSNPLGLYFRSFFFVVVATSAVGSDLRRPFVSVFTGVATDPELRDHRPDDQLFTSNSRRALWAILRKCLLLTGSLLLAASEAICLISSGTQKFVPIP